MHVHLTTYDWWLIGRYGTLPVLAGLAWLSRRRRFPHRHDGYVTASGYARACRRCGRLPDGAYRAGAYGLLDLHELNALSARDAEITRAFRAGYHGQDNDWNHLDGLGWPEDPDEPAR